MKRIILSCVALVAAALVLVLSGCEVSLKKEETTTGSTQPETVIVEITDEAGNVVATESVTITDDVVAEGENFFGNNTEKESRPSGVSSDRIQQGLNNGGVTAPKGEGEKTTSAGKNESNKDDNFIKDNGNTGKLTDAQILGSTQYMITGRLEDAEGNSTPYKIARNGERFSVYTEFNGNEIGLIFLEDKIYMLTTTEKKYIEISKSFLAQNTDDEDILAMFSGSALDKTAKVVKTVKETEDGVVYNVSVYETGEKDYYLGGKIIKTVSPDGGVLYYDTVSAVAPESVFAPPSDYKRETINEEYVSNMAGMVETTHDHDHNHE